MVFKMINPLVKVTKFFFFNGHFLLATWADRKDIGSLPGKKEHLFERQSLLQQRELDHVVVVADRDP